MTALAARPRRGAILLGAGALSCAGLALMPGEPGPTAARAGLAAVSVAALAALARRRPTGPGSPLRVTARAGLSRDASLALVEVEGRRLLVGATGHSVDLLCELAGEREERA